MAAKDVLSAETTAIFHADMTETHAAANTTNILIQEIPHAVIQEDLTEIPGKHLAEITASVQETETIETTEATGTLADAKAVVMEETLKTAKDAVFPTEEVSAEEAARQETTNIDFVSCF